MAVEKSSDEQKEFERRLKEELIKIIDQGILTARESQVLELRFGLNGGKAYSIDEVAAQFGVSRERIRQIENKAIRKIRHQSNQCTKRIIGLGAEAQDPDERLIQCVIENGVALGNPKQFSLCSVGITNEMDMTLMTRGDHLLITLKITPESNETQATMDFIHFSSKDAFELVILSSSQYTLASLIDKKKCKKSDLHITLLKTYGVDAEVASLLLSSATDACASIAEIALSLIDQLIRSKCTGLSLKDFGYCSYE